jgi:hypothetical protein
LKCHLKATWDIPQARFTPQKVTRQSYHFDRKE